MARALAASPVILVVCTGNTCRSPMTEALLRRALADRGFPGEVRSAGRLAEGEPASAGAVQAMAAYGLDLSGHRSQRLRAADVRAAELILGLSREHVRDVVVLEPAAWSRTFSIKEIVRRGGQLGARRPEEPWGAWLARLHEARERAELFGESPEDDVADPMGGPLAGYVETAELLDGLVAALVTLLLPSR